jgi:hypothetical protein
MFLLEATYWLIITNIKFSLDEYPRFFNRLKDKPFWIWDVEQHKAEDRRWTKGDCCFNHIIGLHIGRAVFEELKLRESIIAFITNNRKYLYRFDSRLL